VHLERGPKQVSPGAFGYSYQWWLVPNDPDAFSAIGVYNQYIYINTRTEVVIAKASANPRFGSSYDEAGYRDEEHMALFAAIADSIYQRRRRRRPTSPSRFRLGPAPSCSAQRYDRQARP